MEMVDTRKDKKPYLGLHSILGNVTLGGKSSDATPNLPDAVVRSIFQGLPYPASLSFKHVFVAYVQNNPSI